MILTILQKHYTETPNFLDCDKGKYIWGSWEYNTGYLRYVHIYGHLNKLQPC